MRILVTGSRGWGDRDAIDSALYGAWAEFHGAEGPIVLVHGDCPTGADAIADYLWRARSGGEPVEAHPADWSIGRKAGPERNAHMVSLGANLCLAFIGPCSSPRCSIKGVHASHGATGCADLAEMAGIKTVRHYAPELTQRDTRPTTESEADRG